MATGEEPKDELKKLMREVEEESEEIKPLLDKVVKWNQQVHDLAEASQELVQYTPDTETDIETQISYWQQLRDEQIRTLAGLGPVSSSLGSFLATSTAQGTLSATNAEDYIHLVPEERRQSVRLASLRLSHVIAKFADKDEVEDLMREFDLDKPHANKKSPLEQFRIAWAAYETPVTDTSPSITSLIPMRECIKDTIEDMLRRRRTNSPASSWRQKIISIGNQASSAGYKPINFIDLADQLVHPNNHRLSLESRLSSAKDEDLDRDHWLDLLRRSTLFLKALLLSVDPKRLRKPR
jgi:hypothetical protein